MYADRVKDTTTAPGVGTVTLANAAPTGYQTFAAAFTTGTLVSYCIADQSGNGWEVGTGTFTVPATLTRTTVLASSNGGSLTNFSGGTQDVFCTAPAKFLDTFTSSNQGTVPASGGGTVNFLRADGTFAAPPSGSPASPTTSVQFNNAGAFGGASTFTYNSGTDTLSVGKLVSANFTSAAQGLVPASGGGTTNFLRADGSFAAPPATAPAGSTTQIQFNSSNAFGASANFTYNTGTNTFTVGPAGSNVNSTITTVAPTGSTVAGILRLLGTNASATNGIGGGITLTTGNGTGTQRGGNFILTSGAGGSTGNGGNITITSGTGRQGGNFSMVAGFGSNTAGGSFSMAGGQGSTLGGALILEGGDGASSGGDITIRSGSTFGGFSGSINISAGQGGAAGNGILTLQQGAMLAEYSGGGDDPVIHKIGFFNTTPIVKPTITGSRASGAALQDLLTQLASLGLITDSTTA